MGDLVFIAGVGVTVDSEGEPATARTRAASDADRARRMALPAPGRRGEAFVRPENQTVSDGPAGPGAEAPEIRRE